MAKQEGTGSSNSQMGRRKFLQAGAGLAALGTAGVAGDAKRILGANDRVRVAVCGIRQRGYNHIQCFSTNPHSEVAAVCDIDENVTRKSLSDMEKAGYPKPKTYVDVRRVLADKSIDAISVATPNHWHSLMGIWACQAGKDVYIEKPCCHNWWEGRQLVRATNRYGRIVQHGTEGRSSLAVLEGIRKIREGLIGDVYMARGLCYKWRDTIGNAPEQPVPSGVHYDLWTGPAPVHAFTRNRFHYNWHWFWYYGNGDIGNQGIHQVDIARWGLGAGFPNRVSAVGGHFMFDDDQETPNTLNCAFEYDLPNGKRKMLEFEVRHWMSNHEATIGAWQDKKAHEEAGNSSKRGVEALAGTRNTVGEIFYGSKGYLAMDEDNDTYSVWLGKAAEPGPGNDAGGNFEKANQSHFDNFVECVRSRRKQDLRAPIEEGFISCTLVHLANASYRLRRPVNFDPESQTVINDPEADLIMRDGDRGYRAPFVVPEEV
ncbi:MAG TPA: Gfo/Idh/MocA family oxidoreductase [Terriglobia bacterium]|nr:Gfo/Idh/MocA family oxidoreductase [Terriglobia bacterium]